MILEDLAQETLQDEYFLELLSRLERLNAEAFLKTKDIAFEAFFSEKEYHDALRFADILSHAPDGRTRNIAYKLISLLSDFKGSDDTFGFFANAVLSKIGNFPGILFIDKKINVNQQILPFERQTEKLVKVERQKVPHDKSKVFTDSQFAIFESLKASNHYSFSGPTSLGKSFVLQAFIRHLTRDGNLDAPNIVVLVPTRALINEVSAQIRSVLGKDSPHTVLTRPVVPEYFRRKHEGGYIFVFTPERLISYLMEKAGVPKVDYLFVDEAQKIVSDSDERSPLYYHAILQAEKKSIKLFFASPNIPNPGVFLKIFEKSQDESRAFSDSPVAQNRYFIDLEERKALLFHGLDQKEETVLSDIVDVDVCSWIVRLGSGSSNVVYLNTPRQAIRFARKFIEGLPSVNDPNIDGLVKLIEERVHKQYYLIDCLKKGVAFHYGRLPQEIRLQVEDLFRKRVIKYVFCTSTLLEGVNLPAKNVFVLSNYVGSTKMPGIDFWNLAGRAGRLTEELVGNVVCIRVPASEFQTNASWHRPDSDLELIRDTKVGEIEPTILSGRGNLYQNISAALDGSAFTRKSASEVQKNIWNHYANIALIHEIRDDQSVLRANLVKEENALETLLKRKDQNRVPDRILSLSSSIKQVYQNKIYSQKEPFLLGDSVDYDSVLYALGRLFRDYNWQDEESGGIDPLCPTENVLKYLAAIASDWMGGKSLNQMIGGSIAYHVKIGRIFIVSKRKEEFFDKANRDHLNIVIDDVIGDIDSKLRFKLQRYFENYYLLLEARLGVGRAGANWANYLEYGTSDERVIALQNFGVSRHLANYLLKAHGEVFTFDGPNLVDIDKKGLLDKFDKEADEYREYEDSYLAI